VKVSNGYYFSGAIDSAGKLYTWGKGLIGHKGQTSEDFPKLVEINTENRIFTDILCSQKLMVAYAPI